MSTIEVRKAIEQDREAIALINAKAFAKDWNFFYPDSNKVAQALAAGIFIPVYYVAVIDKQVVGFISCCTQDQRAQKIIEKAFQKTSGFFKGYMIAMMLKKEFEEPLHFSSHQLYIDILAVDPLFHHQGIASKMLSFALENTQASEIIIKTSNNNIAALACYQKAGFAVYKSEKVSYAKQKGFNEYIYLKYEKANNSNQ